MRDVFPKRLKEEEEKFIKRRHDVLPPGNGSFKTTRLGLALSGGGIRSATFCLGVLQTLARTRVLRSVDYLSTVSGGGYIGGFLGTLFVRKKCVDDVEGALSNNHSTELRWLRENGRYLAPNGSGDLLTALAVQFRNWLAVVTVIGISLLVVFLALYLARFESGAHGFLSLPEGTQFWWWSPWVVPTVAMAAVALVLAWGYWLVSSPHYKLVSRHLSKLAMVVWLIICVRALKLPDWKLLFSWHDFWAPDQWSVNDIFSIVFKSGLGLGAGTVLWSVGMWLWVWLEQNFELDQKPAGPLAGTPTVTPGVFGRMVSGIKGLFRRESGGGQEAYAQSRDRTRKLQNLYAAALKVCLVLTGCLLAFAILDSLGQSLYRATEHRWTLKAIWTASGFAFLFSFGDKLMTFAQKFSGGKSIKPSLKVIALLAGLVSFFLFLLNLDILAHAIAWQGNVPNADTAPDKSLLYLCLGGSVILAVIFGKNLLFLNTSSLQYLYGARLVRAYLGATNPLRHSPREVSVTEVVDGDDCTLVDYQPYQTGGPLHLISVTFNETCSGESQLEQRDRKGMQFAIGPAGISVSTWFHCLWHPNKNSGDSAEIEPIPAGDPAKNFQMFPIQRGLFERTRTLFHVPTSTPPSTRLVQRLTLGHWIAISGAAFGTGLGQGNSLGFSLLAGLSNLRLGYWWDSFVEPRERGGNIVSPGAGAKVARLGSWFFRVQSYLLDEWLCRFHGPARRHWYLSDGGHFENTAVYEMLRRRVPHIICCDCGADPNYDFTDLANLVRKARIDFGAEMVFFSRDDVLRAAQKLNLPEVKNLAAGIGMPDDFVAGRKDGRQPHALLAAVRFPPLLPEQKELDDKASGGASNTQQPVEPEQEFALILFLKPALSGDEPLDVWEYDVQRRDFPQESTVDQFFDEAQWESYRKLGEHTSEHILACESGRPFWFLQLNPKDLWPYASQYDQHIDY